MFKMPWNKKSLQYIWENEHNLQNILNLNDNEKYYFH